MTTSGPSHSLLRGRIQYTSRKPERMGQERGREWFFVAKHPDGSRTITAHCEIDEPAPTVVRDVIYSLDGNNNPLDCHIRLSLGGQYLSSAWFRMGEGMWECESFGPTTGRTSQKIPVAPGHDGFGPHPLVCDGYNTIYMDASKGPHKRQKRSYSPSLDHRGATAAMLSENRLFLEYVGDETVTVQAGEFRCRRFRYSDEAGAMKGAHGEHPHYDLWVTADDDAIFVQGGVVGYMQTWYELVELHRE